MSTGAVIAIVIGAIILIALIVLLSRAARNKRLEGRREEAGELRREAQTRTLRAERQQASADEQQARAKQAEGEAEERAAAARRESAAAQERARAAEREHAVAREHHERALEVDPDVSADDADHPAGTRDRR